MEKEKMTSGQRIKMLRELKGFTQERLAEFLNVSPKTISAWETNEREVNLSNVKILSEFFGVPEPFIPYGVDNEMTSRMKNDIDKYILDSKKQEKIDELFAKCKKQIISDGLEFKKEYLPVFDKEEFVFVSSGVFNESSLPLKEKENCYNKKVLDDELLNSVKEIKYSPKGLVDNELYSFAKKRFKNEIILTDLINCDSFELFEIAMDNVKHNKHKESSGWCFDSQIRYEYDKSFEVEQLIDTLENLSPNLINFWKIIAYLIDNGAYYLNVFEINDYDEHYERRIKDISKTNLVYRIAKDNLK